MDQDLIQALFNLKKADNPKATRQESEAYLRAATEKGLDDRQILSQAYLEYDPAYADYPEELNASVEKAMAKYGRNPYREQLPMFAAGAVNQPEEAPALTQTKPLAAITREVGSQPVQEPVQLDLAGMRQGIEDRRVAAITPPKPGSNIEKVEVVTSLGRVKLPKPSGEESPLVMKGVDGKPVTVSYEKAQDAFAPMLSQSLVSAARKSGDNALEVAIKSIPVNPDFEDVDNALRSYATATGGDPELVSSQLTDMYIGAITNQGYSYRKAAAEARGYVQSENAGTFLGELEQGLTDLLLGLYTGTVKVGEATAQLLGTPEAIIRGQSPRELLESRFPSAKMTEEERQQSVLGGLDVLGLNRAYLSSQEAESAGIANQNPSEIASQVNQSIGASIPAMVAPEGMGVVVALQNLATESRNALEAEQAKSGDRYASPGKEAVAGFFGVLAGGLEQLGGNKLEDITAGLSGGRGFVPMLVDYAVAQPGKEITQEVVSQFVTNLGAKATYDESRKLNEGMEDIAKIAAVSTYLMGAPGAAISLPGAAVNDLGSGVIDGINSMRAAIATELAKSQDGDAIQLLRNADLELKQAAAKAMRSMVRTQDKIDGGQGETLQRIQDVIDDIDALKGERAMKDAIIAAVAAREQAPVAQERVATEQAPIEPAQPVQEAPIAAEETVVATPQGTVAKESVVEAPVVASELTQEPLSQQTQPNIPQAISTPSGEASFAVATDEGYRVQGTYTPRTGKPIEIRVANDGTVESRQAGTDKPFVPTRKNGAVYQMGLKMFESMPEEAIPLPGENARVDVVTEGIASTEPVMSQSDPLLSQEAQVATPVIDQALYQNTPGDDADVLTAGGLVAGDTATIEYADGTTESVTIEEQRLGKRKRLRVFGADGKVKPIEGLASGEIVTITKSAPPQAPEVTEGIEPTIEAVQANEFNNDISTQLSEMLAPQVDLVGEQATAQTAQAQAQLQTAFDQRLTLKWFDSFFNFVKQSFGSNIALYTEQGEFDAAVANFNATNNQTVNPDDLRAFVSPDGKSVYINPSKATVGTLFHEYASVWLAAMKSSSPAVYANIVNKFKVLAKTNPYLKAKLDEYIAGREAFNQTRGVKQTRQQVYDIAVEELMQQYMAEVLGVNVAMNGVPGPKFFDRLSEGAKKLFQNYPGLNKVMTWIGDTFRTVEKSLFKNKFSAMLGGGLVGGLVSGGWGVIPGMLVGPMYYAWRKATPKQQVDLANAQFSEFSFLLADEIMSEPEAFTFRTALLSGTYSNATSMPPNLSSIARESGDVYNKLIFNVGNLLNMSSIAQQQRDIDAQTGNRTPDSERVVPVESEVEAEELDAPDAKPANAKFEQPKQRFYVTKLKDWRKYLRSYAQGTSNTAQFARALQRELPQDVVKRTQMRVWGTGYMSNGNIDVQQSVLTSQGAALIKNFHAFMFGQVTSNMALNKRSHEQAFTTRMLKLMQNTFSSQNLAEVDAMAWIGHVFSSLQAVSGRNDATYQRSVESGIEQSYKKALATVDKQIAKATDPTELEALQEKRLQIQQNMDLMKYGATGMSVVFVDNAGQVREMRLDENGVLDTPAVSLMAPMQGHPLLTAGSGYAQAAMFVQPILDQTQFDAYKQMHKQMVDQQYLVYQGLVKSGELTEGFLVDMFNRYAFYMPLNQEGINTSVQRDPGQRDDKLFPTITGRGHMIPYNMRVNPMEEIVRRTEVASKRMTQKFLARELGKIAREIAVYMGDNPLLLSMTKEQWDNYPGKESMWPIKYREEDVEMVLVVNGGIPTRSVPGAFNVAESLYVSLAGENPPGSTSDVKKFFGRVESWLQKPGLIQLAKIVGGYGNLMRFSAIANMTFVMKQAVLDPISTVRAMGVRTPELGKRKYLDYLVNYAKSTSLVAKFPLEQLSVWTDQLNNVIKGNLDLSQRDKWTMPEWIAAWKAYGASADLFDIESNTEASDRGRATVRTADDLTPGAAEIFEGFGNSVAGLARMAAFMTVMKAKDENGNYIYTPDEAAVITQESATNYNTKGRFSAQLSPMYFLFNGIMANIRRSVRTAEIIGTGEGSGKRMLEYGIQSAALTTLGLTASLLGYVFGIASGDDEEKRSQGEKGEALRQILARNNAARSQSAIMPLGMRLPVAPEELIYYNIGQGIGNTFLAPEGGKGNAMGTMFSQLLEDGLKTYTPPGLPTAVMKGVTVDGDLKSHLRAGMIEATPTPFLKTGVALAYNYAPFQERPIYFEKKGQSPYDYDPAFLHHQISGEVIDVYKEFAFGVNKANGAAIPAIRAAEIDYILDNILTGFGQDAAGMASLYNYATLPEDQRTARDSWRYAPIIRGFTFDPYTEASRTLKKADAELRAKKAMGLPRIEEDPILRNRSLNQAVRTRMDEYKKK